MKKLLIILLMLVYGVTSSGMTVTLHYCCGKLDDISFTGKQEKQCPMGSKHMKNSSCCKDTQLTAKLAADQQLAAKWIASAQSNQAEFAPAFSIDLFNRQVVTGHQLARGAPVPYSTVPLFIKHCVFRI